MELKIYWTRFAKDQLNDIFRYHQFNVDVKIAREIVKEIVLQTKTLINFPKSGSVEKHLLNRPQEFRYLVYTNYKIIYWINLEQKRIEIVDVFDVRQDPEKMKRNK